MYESSDYSKDGEVTALQTATRGNGINIVLLGDAFSDRLVADGTYDGTMRKAMEHFFSEEPYKSFRDLFNVYAVNVVSKNEAYGSGAQTALDGFFGDGTHVGGNDDKCRQYAMKVPGITYDNIDNALIIVMMNRTYYAGTCYMYYPSSGDYGQGLSIAYFPLGTDDGMFGQLLHHEAGGHGFPKLADEYAYEEYGRFPGTRCSLQSNWNPMDGGEISTSRGMSRKSNGAGLSPIRAMPPRYWGLTKGLIPIGAGFGVRPTIALCAIIRAGSTLRVARRFITGSTSWLMETHGPMITKRLSPGMP